MKAFTYSVTFEYDKQEPDHVKGTVQATSAATAAARCLRENKGTGKRAGSIVIVLTPTESAE